MARLRIATEGRTGVSFAQRLHEVIIGRGVVWVEIDGVRVEDVSGVRIGIQKGFQVNVIELDSAFFEEGVAAEIEVLGNVELVYVGADGEPLT